MAIDIDSPCLRTGNGCPWNENTCSNAALNGHMDCLVYARENGCPWNQRTCSKHWKVTWTVWFTPGKTGALGTSGRGARRDVRSHWLPCLRTRKRLSHAQPRFWRLELNNIFYMRNINFIFIRFYGNEFFALLCISVYCVSS